MPARSSRSAIFAAQLLLAGLALAQESEALQKQLANPIADLITLPFQYTATANTGPTDAWQHALNFQPVYPVKISQDWRLIHRAILPILSNPGRPGQEHQTGIGDLTYEGFYTPVQASKGLIWGIGPILNLNTASSRRLGDGKHSIGPAAVFVMEPGKWTYGALVSQLWSFAGAGHRQSVSRFQLQPIISYRLSPRHSLGYTGIIIANWHQESSQRWTVPLGLTLSTLTRPKDFVPVNYIVGAGYNVVRPDSVGTWFVRLQVNFVIPK